jgi:hypothetical protein
MQIVMWLGMRKLGRDDKSMVSGSLDEGLRRKMEGNRFRILVV